MYHSFPIHSSADGHLGCFHVLAIINSAEAGTGPGPKSLKVLFLYMQYNEKALYVCSSLD